MQKQYEDILMVDVPKDATEPKDFELFKIREERFIRYYDKGKDYLIDLPEGNWELINPLNLVSEEQALPMVKSLPHPIDYRKRIYKDYSKNKSWPADNYTKDTALEALNSLATHLGFENANPIVLHKIN